MLAASGIIIPETVRFVPVDFERQSLRDQLEAANFHLTKPCFFAWLGVVPYLTLEAFQSTISLIAQMPLGSGVTFDYGLPRASLPQLEQLAHDSLSARVEAAGEPFRLFFTPEQVKAELHAFWMTEDLDTADISSRYFAARTDGLNLLGSAAHLITAWR
jgi:O-methyltransferase involved in polyketide biosynthesis